MNITQRTGYSQLKKSPYLSSISCSSKDCASGTCDAKLPSRVNQKDNNIVKKINPVIMRFERSI